jgi:bifunctional ADP-heptose synthase (sugar kinase/adenylyltransferase)
MFFIDAVVPFSEETPLNLIKAILPDVLVKGGDYEIAQIAGSKEVLANGGEVRILSFLPGYSSSAVIEKIKKS